jgi:preprotein translocase subunit SecE
VANDTTGSGSLFHELFSFGLYKRSQGRIARQATFAAFAVIVGLGAWALSKELGAYVSDVSPNNPDWPVWKQNAVHYFIPLALLAVGLWASFRIVQMPTFADFLISVEGEMNKVSWPSRGELFRASLVVILVIFFLAFLLYAYDFVLTWVLGFLDNAIGWIFG